MFRGRDGTSLHQLFRDSLLAHYEALLGSVQANYIAPNDYYTAIIDAMNFTGDNPILELSYLFEFYR